MTQFTNSPKIKAAFSVTLLVSLLMGSLWTSKSVMASHDIGSEIQFIAWSADAKHLVVQIQDDNRGTFLAVKQTGSLASVHEQPLEGTPAAEALAHPYYVALQLNDGGAQSPSSPEGLMLMGSPHGNAFRIFLSNGQQLVPVMDIPLQQDVVHGTVAQASLKGVIWSSNNLAAAVIVNQTIQSDHGMNVDEIHSFMLDPHKKKLQAAAPAEE